MNSKNSIRHFHKEESGQDLLEYALVLAVVLAAIVSGSDGIATAISNGLNTLITQVNNIVK